MNNTPDTMVHYRIKSSAKSKKENKKDLTVPMICTIATIFSVISAISSVAIFTKAKKRRFKII